VQLIAEPRSHANQLSEIDEVRSICNVWDDAGGDPNLYGAYGFYGAPRVYGRPLRRAPRRGAGYD
jgi:hypothetical protein